MAQSCPCGCGRKVGWSKKGPAKVYPDVVTLAWVAGPAMDWIIATDRPELADWPELQVKTSGSRTGAANVQRWLLEHLHGEARPNQTPDLMELTGMIRAMRPALISAVGVSDQLGGPGPRLDPNVPGLATSIREELAQAARSELT
jgi:hypothetical protein